MGRGEPPLSNFIILVRDCLEKVSLYKTMDQDSQDGYNGKSAMHRSWHRAYSFSCRVQEYDITHGEPIIDMARQKNRDLIDFSCLMRRAMEMVDIGCAGGLLEEVEGGG